MAKIKESDLFYPLNRYFNALHYIVNTEVENKFGYKRADILLTKPEDDTVIGIELKTSLSFELLDQAYYWSNYTDFNYICVPKIKKERPLIVNKIISDLGIGFIEIDLKRYNRYYSMYKDDPYFVYVTQDGSPDLYKLGIKFTINAKANNADDRLKQQLLSVIYAEHQTWAIGGQQASDGYVSTYKLLMRDVYEYLRLKLEDDSEGWVTSRDIWDYLKQNSSEVVKSHYRGNNIASSIGQALRKYEDGDVENLKINNKYYYKIIADSTKFLDMDKLKKDIGDDWYECYEEL